MTDIDLQLAILDLEDELRTSDIELEKARTAFALLDAWLVNLLGTDFEAILGI